MVVGTVRTDWQELKLGWRKAQGGGECFNFTGTDRS